MRLIRHARRNAVAYLALTVALGGTSYAAVSLPRNSVGSTQIKKDAVSSSKVKDGSLLAKDFKASQLPKGAKGDKGDPGPSTGPAGGALSGTYPNPALAAGSVGAANMAAVPTARVYRATSLAAPQNASTVIPFTGEENDTFNMHDNTTNPDRITVPVDGIYLVNASVSWSGGAGSGIRILNIDTSDRPRSLGYAYINTPVGAEDTTQTTAQIPLHAGDYVRVSTYNTGAGVTLTPYSSPPEVSIAAQVTWVAPLG